MTNIDQFDEWVPRRQDKDVKPHQEYYVEHDQMEAFKELHSSTAFQDAIKTQSRVQKAIFRHIPQDKYNIIKLCHNYEVV